MIEPSLQIGGGNWANKSDKLLGYHKDGANFYADELTFSRNSLGSYTDANGLVQTMPYNLLTYSEDFTNADWNKFEATITANATNSPSGTLTADKFIPNVVSDGHTILQSIVGAPQSFSVYAKASEYNTIILLFTVHNARATFDLSNGTITETDGTVIASVENVGNGWYRCAISTTLTDHNQARIYAINGSTWADRNIAGNGTSGLFIWGAQLNQGSTALPYFATTTRLNLARVDYKDNVNGSLKLEPQRTNLALYSSEFDNAAWEFGGITKTANATTSPDGTSNADKIEITTLTTPNLRQTVVVLPSTNYTFSFYAKSSELSVLKLAVYDLNGAAFIFENTEKSITNEWSRVTVSFATPSGCSSIRVFIFRNSDSLGSFYLYGAQLELGSYSTSLINTSGTTVTRLQDAAGDSNFTPSSNKATLFIEIKGDDNTINRNVCGFRNGTTNQYGLFFWGSDNNKFGFNSWAGDSYGITNSTIFDGNTHKIAAVFDFSDFTQNVLYIDGVKQTISQTRGATLQRSQNKVSLSAPLPNENPIQEVINFKCFNEALSDTELAALTTL